MPVQKKKKKKSRHSMDNNYGLSLSLECVMSVHKDQ